MSHPKALVTRTLAVVVDDWAVVAAGVGPDAPAAVLFANRVVACSPAARADGVAVHMRRREAQGRCPGLAVLEHDPARDARAFEPVVAALEALTPRIEVGWPGTCAFATRGPSRYFGGDDTLAVRAAALAAGAAGPHATVRVGVADGPFTAAIAARRAPDGGTLVVPPGASAAFLAPLPVALLDDEALTDVLGRLGLRTLGAVAALPRGDLVARFGIPGEVAHRRASGLDDRPPNARRPPPELTVGAELDPPAEWVDTVAFAARTLAEDLQGRLDVLGLACTRLLVVAETEHGERHERLWRHGGGGWGDRGATAGTGAAFSAGAIADRVRWQLDGWLSGTTWARRPTGGVTLLQLVPDEVGPATGRQLGFWGGDAAVAERAARGVARLQGLLGADAVAVPEWRGGRSPAEQVALVPAAAVDLTAARPAAEPSWVEAPWPGRVPAPSPAAVPPDLVPAEVVDAAGAPVGVTGRGSATAAPARVSIAGGPWVTVDAWAGPWPVEERWWDPAGHRRRARFQIVGADGTARLLVVEQGRWWLEAVYD